MTLMIARVCGVVADAMTKFGVCLAFTESGMAQKNLQGDQALNLRHVTFVFHNFNSVL